jgi:hypothetical protein
LKHNKKRKFNKNKDLFNKQKLKEEKHHHLQSQKILKKQLLSFNKEKK